MITLQFDSFTQLQIFFFLINNKPTKRNVIAKNTMIPRTTVYDNLKKLHQKSINNRPYVNKIICHNGNIGRPITKWFVNGFIKRQFFNIEIPIIKVEHIQINYNSRTS